MPTLLFVRGTDLDTSNSEYDPKLGADLISEMIDSFPAHPSRGTAVFFQMSGGAIARVPSSATAFASPMRQRSMPSATSWATCLAALLARCCTRVRVLAARLISPARRSTCRARSKADLDLIG